MTTHEESLARMEELIARADEAIRAEKQDVARECLAQARAIAKRL